MVGGSDLEIVCEFYQNTLGILWEFYWDSLGCWGVLNVWVLILGNLTLLGLKDKDKENDH